MDAVAAENLTLDSLKDYRLIYLGTPFSKFPKGIVLAYEEAAQLVGRLIHYGIDQVFSPIVHSYAAAVHGKLDPYDYTLWTRVNDHFMRKCDLLLVAKMKSWDTSFGLAGEIRWFKDHKKPILFLDPINMEVSREGN